MMRIYWLANYTTGANWDTVAQLFHREEYDRRLSAITDGYVPLQSWEDKVATAMRAIKQDRHFTKEGMPVGPVLPRLARKLPEREYARSAQRGRGSSCSFHWGAKSRGRGFSHRESDGYREAGGKERRHAGAPQ
jgi:hypothetical protein